MARIIGMDRAITAVLTNCREQAQTALADLVEDELGKVVNRDKPSSFDQFIDGIQGRRIRDIEPYGNAFFRFHYGREVVEWALDLLRTLSPVASGKYRSSHAVFVNGGIVTDLSAIDVSGTVVIANISAYAARIETMSRWWYHKTKKYGPVVKGAPRKWSLMEQAPDTGIYHYVAATINRKWGNLIFASFDWAQIGGEEDMLPSIVLTPTNSR